ncbi:MAG TPA: carbohydrate binding domain-containing protein, partial [Nocardioides sp.]|uniref:carbohydrate binding domain-containing protein n=1 Tax=Nocardioides sp. TaxID=35761 RepID=UPI002CE9C297
WLAIVAGVALLAVGAPSALAETGGSEPRQVAARADSPELVFNGHFENGTRGWKTNHRGRQVISHARRAASGAGAARLTSRRGRAVMLNDARQTVASTPRQTTYTASAYVRSSGRDLTGRLRVREVTDHRVIAAASSRFVAVSSRWTKVELAYTTVRTGTALDLNVFSLRVPRGVALLVDDVSMREGDLTTDPTVPPAGEPLPSGPPTPGPCVSDPMGIPTPGSTYLGAAISGDTSLPTREAQLGGPLALHRTYYKATQISNAVRDAKADLAEGRLPWMSFKAPLSWADMAAGKGTAWSTQLADALATVPGPVWLAVHHEPENDGDMALWTQMQAQIAPIIHARTDNVAYSVIYSGWNTFGGGNNTVATKWPGDENIDILAIDAYNDYGAVRNGKVGTKVLDLTTYYAKMAAWATEHGTAWAIGETGQTAVASAVDPTWLDRTYHDMVAMGGAGLSYYDSTANSVADWTLDDPVKFSRFQGLMPWSARLC